MNGIEPVHTPAAVDTPERKKLRNATRQVESYFVATLLKKMHESAARSAGGTEDSGLSMYREMFDDAVAAEIAKTGAFGIGDMLYREMVGHVDASSKQKG